MTHKYKLKSDAPYLFIFVHCPDEDINLTECFDPRSEEQKKIVDSGNWIPIPANAHRNYVITRKVGLFVWKSM